MSPPPTLLQTEGLSKDFGAFRAVHNVSVSLQPGELTALIGPNGAGKTTFYNLVSGRLRPTEGRIRFDGRDVTGLPPHQLTRLGMARSFQITNVFSELTVLENVMVSLVPLQRKGLSLWRSVARDQQLRSEGMAILERVGLADQADTQVATLSYGDKRLVELAIALATAPKLVLLDEPTAGMTPEGTARIIELVRSLAAEGELTFFLTEHDMDVVFDLAQRVLVMHHGELLADGTPKEIRADPEVRTAYLGEGAPT